MLSAKTGLADTPTIVGGENARPGDWAATAEIHLMDEEDPRESHICGGSLIDAEWVLTAAHCVESHDPADLLVVVGRTNLLTDDGRETAVQQIVVHADYGISAPEHDIALLRLAQTVDETPVQLPPADAILPAGAQATVVGWGATVSGRYSLDLQELTVPVVETAVCNQQRSYNGRVTANMICAGFAEGGRDACYGDSGGPLYHQSDEGRQQVGIVSWGQGCALPHKYGVYTRITSYLSWIDECRSDDPGPQCLRTADIAGQSDDRGDLPTIQRIYLPLVLNR